MEKSILLVIWLEASSHAKEGAHEGMDSGYDDALPALPNLRVENANDGMQSVLVVQYLDCSHSLFFVCRKSLETPNTGSESSCIQSQSRGTKHVKMLSTWSSLSTHACFSYIQDLPRHAMNNDHVRRKTNQDVLL